MNAGRHQEGEDVQGLRIEQISLKGFGCYDEGVELHLPDTNTCVIMGPNESGKSTLAEAIAAVVFGFESRELERSYEPWKEGAEYDGAVQILAGGARYRINRNFVSHEVSVTKDGEVLLAGQVNPRGRHSPERTMLEGKLEELFGFSQREIFAKCAFVRQLEVETELSAQIRRLLSGAGPRDYVAALDFLYEEHDKLTVDGLRGGRKRKDRLIEQAQETLRGLAASLEVARRSEREDLELQSRLEVLVKERDEVKRRERELRSSVEYCGRLLDLRNRLDRAEQEYRQIEEEKKRTERRLNEQGGLREKLFRDYPDLAGITPQVRKELAQAAALIQEKRRLGVEIEKLARPARGRAGSSRRRSVLFALVLGLASGSLASALGLEPAAAVITGLAVGALAVVVWLFATAPALRETADGMAELLNAREKLERDLSEYSESVLILAGTDRILQKLASASEMLGQLQAIAQELSAGRTVDDLERELSRVTLEVASLRERIEQLQQERPYLKERSEDLAVTVERLGADLEDARLRAGEIEGERKDIEVSLGVLKSAGPRCSPPSIMEEIEEGKLVLGGLQLRRDAIRIAVEELKAAVDDCSEDCVGDVERRTGELLSKITGGKYNKVTLEGRNMKPALTNAAGRHVVPDAVSCGTRDQLFLSLRISMLEGLSQHRRLPLILDDCLVSFDDRRLEQAGCILLAIAEQGHQVIVLTHDRRLTNWGVPVVALDAVDSMRSQVS